MIGLVICSDEYMSWTCEVPRLQGVVNQIAGGILHAQKAHLTPTHRALVTLGVVNSPLSKKAIFEVRVDSNRGEKISETALLLRWLESELSGRNRVSLYVLDGPLLHFFQGVRDSVALGSHKGLKRLNNEPLFHER